MRRPNELFTDLQHRRWFVIDEIENVGVELLGSISDLMHRIVKERMGGRRDA